MRSRLSRFCADAQAMAAIEFAFILPVLLILYIGSVDVTQAISVDSKVTAATNSIGDLVAQGGTIQSAEMDDIFQAATAILTPYDVSPLSLIVSSVRVTKNGAEVICSKAYETAPHAKGAAIDLPDNVASAGATVIVAEGNYSFTPIFSAFVAGTLELSDTFYLRPRTVDEVSFAGC